MIGAYIDSGYVPDRGSASWRALMASAFWLRIGYVGASVAIIALIAFFTGDTAAWIAALSGVGGALVAAWAWRRSWVILDRADAGTPEPPKAEQPMNYGVSSAASD